MSLQNAHISTVWAFKASLSACQLLLSSWSTADRQEDNKSSKPLQTDLAQNNSTSTKKTAKQKLMLKTIA